MREMIRVLAVIAITFALFVSTAIGPVFLCRLGSSSGSCGEWTLASLPLGLLLVPLFIFLGVRWTKDLG